MYATLDYILAKTFPSTGHPQPHPHPPPRTPTSHPTPLLPASRFCCTSHSSSIIKNRATLLRDEKGGPYTCCRCSTRSPVARLAGFEPRQSDRCFAVSHNKWIQTKLESNKQRSFHFVTSGYSSRSCFVIACFSFFARSRVVVKTRHW